MTGDRSAAAANQGFAGPEKANHRCGIESGAVVTGPKPCRNHPRQQTRAGLGVLGRPRRTITAYPAWYGVRRAGSVLQA